jgi:hypothetical protein
LMEAWYFFIAIKTGWFHENGISLKTLFLRV